MVKIEHNLYRVTLQGMTHNYTGTPHGDVYVVARDSHTAYEIVRADLDDRDVGFHRERELKSVELLATTDGAIRKLYID